MEGVERTRQGGLRTAGVRAHEGEFPAAGLYELELSATDGEFTERVRLNVKAR